MVKGRSLLRGAGILLVCASVLFICIEAQGEKGPVKPPASGRPDLIKIDILAAFGKLELPPVMFSHDKHTEALLKEKKSCDTCHAVKEHKLTLEYKGIKAGNPAAIKDVFHASCIGCHNETAVQGKKTGPLDGFCRSCHDATPTITKASLNAGLNKVLHYRHLESQSIPATAVDKNNCGVCHHDYDKKTKKTFYAKGKEEACNSCHGDKPQGGVKSLQQASHQQCVLCHYDLAEKGVKENGPYDCAGCHGAKGQALVAKKNQEVLAKLPNREVPRLMRGQPNAALITYNPKNDNGKAEKPLLMSPVAFDHKAHEKYNDNCKVCHHQGIESCDKCHTLGGAEKGKFVTYEQAMHSKASQQSCLGCHTAKQATANCAGCHNHISKAGLPDTASCKQCHMQMPEGVSMLQASLSPAQKADIAEKLLKSRNLNLGTYAISDIPEKVKIKALSDKYEPVELNHRAHVAALLKGTQGNTLAEYFHRDPGTLCQGCHHHSPPAKDPPGCINCHSKNLRAKEENRPELLAAMHNQCMGCHRDMKVEKPADTACIECHLEKQK